MVVCTLYLIDTAAWQCKKSKIFFAIVLAKS